MSAEIKSDFLKKKLVLFKRFETIIQKPCLKGFQLGSFSLKFFLYQCLRLCYISCMLHVLMFLLFTKLCTLFLINAIFYPPNLGDISSKIVKIRKLKVFYLMTTLAPYAKCICPVCEIVLIPVYKRNYCLIPLIKRTSKRMYGVNVNWIKVISLLNL